MMRPSFCERGVKHAHMARHKGGAWQQRVGGERAVRFAPFEATMRSAAYFTTPATLRHDRAARSVHFETL